MYVYIGLFCGKSSDSIEFDCYFWCIACILGVTRAFPISLNFQYMILQFLDCRGVLSQILFQSCVFVSDLVGCALVDTHTHTHTHICFVLVYVYLY